VSDVLTVPDRGSDDGRPVLFNSIGQLVYRVQFTDGTQAVLVDTIADDCNDNEYPDPYDIRDRNSADCDFNGVPDECQSNADGDDAIDACDECVLDPLRVVVGRCGCNGPAEEVDFDGDCVVNLADFRVFVACLGGPDVGVGTFCAPADLAVDGFVDLFDMSWFLTASSK